MKPIARRLDAVYDWADRLMWAGQPEQMDRVLQHMQSKDVDILLGFLTATLPMRERLPGRHRIYEMVKALDPTPGLLHGLEP